MTAGHEFLYQFGPFSVSGRERVLLREGVPVSLAPKALDILLVLIRNSGHLVAKDQLMAEVWPETFVEESNLTQNISVLRKVLDDGSQRSSCIETVPRRGYRFLLNVRQLPELTAATESEAAEKFYRLLAIMPFDNASNDHQMDYLSDGITESIISSLSHLPQLRVMSRNAVSRFKGRDIDAQRIGKELGVDAVLLGRVQLLDRRLLISTELVDVANGWQLWGENYDRESKAILELQDEIARQISTTLRLKLTGDDEQQLTRRYTESADAYQAYLQARYHWSTFTREGLEQATIFFREAINLDPNYALAYAGIVDCYLRLASNYIPPIELHVKEQRAAIKSQEKDRQSDEVEKVQEPIKTRYRWDWTGAERELKRANELKSNYPAAHQWHAAYLFSRSLFEEAQRRIQTKSQASPRNDVGPYSRVLEHIRSVTPTRAEETQIFCTIARDQIEVGNYEGACQILSGLWKVGEWPQLDGLSSYSAGDLLFTAGTLTGRLAKSRQMTVGQKLAEALLNGSIGIFESLGLRRRSAEAQIELADCYYSEGLFDLARQTLVSALRSLGDEADLELRSLAQLRLGIVERHSGRLHEALARLTEAADVVDLVGPWITGRYHLETATTLKNLAAAETNEKLFSAAVEHYQSALSEFEAIGNHRYVGIVKNNHGFLLLGLGQYQESLQHLLRARNLFESLGEQISIAQVDDTLARLHIAQGDFEAGNEAISRAIQVLQTCDSEALLSEALVTRGLILARLGRPSEAKRVLDHASQLAERCGYTDGLARASLTMIEEIPETLLEYEKRELAVRIHKLTHTRQSEYQKGRLINCLHRLRQS